MSAVINTPRFAEACLAWEALQTERRASCIDLKLQISEVGDCLYPDPMVTGDPRDRRPGEDRFITHPWLIAEVLSASTASFDRDRRFELDRGIDTLTHYLLIEQGRPYAELVSKNSQGQWVLQLLQAGGEMQIERLGAGWSVDALFEDVAFAGPSAGEAE